MYLPRRPRDHYYVRAVPLTHFITPSPLPVCHYQNTEGSCFRHKYIFKTTIFVTARLWLGKVWGWKGAVIGDGSNRPEGGEDWTNQEKINRGEKMLWILKISSKWFMSTCREIKLTNAKLWFVWCVPNSVHASVWHWIYQPFFFPRTFHLLLSIRWGNVELTSG